MQDAKTSLDNVRAKIPPDAKLLVAWQRPDGGMLVLSQANLSQADLVQFSTAIGRAAAAADVGSAKKVRT